MKRAKTVKKRSLVAGIAILCLCVAALIGGTFAWFTDTASTSVNRIQAGSLDVGLQYKNSTQTAYADVTSATNVFKTDTLWEPGHVEYAVLKISNEGTLALKYNLGISVSSETAGTNVSGNEFKLSDYIQYAVIDGDQSTLTRDALVSAADSSKAALSKVYSSNGNILANDNAKEVTLVVWMPSTVGNEVNYATGTAQPTINLGIDLYATQYTNESDSFNNTYDSAAPWTGGTDNAGLAANTDTEAKTVKIESAEQLASFAKAVNAGNTYVGYTITLNKNLDLNNLAWTPIGTSANEFNGTFDGNNKTISNLNVSGEKYVGLFGNGINVAVVKNVIIDTATVSGVAYVAPVIGKIYGTVTGCQVKNATVSVTGKLNGSVYEDGAKAGAIVGMLGEGTGETITNCSATNVTINGYRDLGGIVGCIYGDNTVTGNTISNVVIKQGDYSNYESGDYTTLGAIYGRNIITSDHTGGTIQANTGDATINAVTIVKKEATQQATQQNVDNALSAAESGTTVVIPDTDNGVKISDVASGVTIKGDGDTKIDATGAYGTSIANVDGATLEGLVINCGSTEYHGFQHSSATFENCTINGRLCTYDSQTFKNCTFNQTSSDYNVWAYSNCSFTGCTFNNSATGKFVNVYTETESAGYKVSFTDCTFNNTSGTSSKAAINVKDSCGTKKLNYEVTIKNCKTTGAFPSASTSSTLVVISSVVQVDDIIAGGGTKVTVNDTKVYPTD